MSSQIKLLLGFLTLLVCLSLQFWLVPFGIRADLAFAALIALAFIFDFLELTAFALAAIFIINWQPGISSDIVAFALIPLVVHVIQRGVHADAWIGVMVAVVFGLLALYLSISPAMIISSFSSFFLDVILCLAVGQIVLWGMESRD
jgi:hypothetical protein